MLEEIKLIDKATEKLNTMKYILQSCQGITVVGPTRSFIINELLDDVQENVDELKKLNE